MDAKDLPDKIRIVMSVEEISVKTKSNPNLEDIAVQNYHNIDKLHKVTSLLLLVGKRKTFKGAWYALSHNVISEAQTMWVRYAQLDILKDWAIRFKGLAPTLSDEGIIVVGNRISIWLMNNWNRKLLILLPYKHPYTNLVLLTAHEEAHEGIETTLEKSQRDYWIP